MCAAAALLGLPGLVAAAHATPPTVTTTTDSNAPGSGSLRAAIAAANPGDTVVVPASPTPYKLTMGEIAIAHAITIQGTGLGPDATVIEATGSHRVFHVATGVPSSGTVTFKDLEITKGSITASPGGGGILADAGKLSLDHVLMTANSAKVRGASNVGGGAVYSNGGDLTITDSTLTGNSVTAGGATSSVLGGGAVFNNGSGTLTITGSTISSNHTSIGAAACCDGGAVLQNVSAAVSITNSHLDGNQFTETAGTTCCSGGGALYQDGNAPVTITSTTLNQNKATITDTNCCDGGGAILMDTNEMQLLSVSDSTLSNDQTVVHTTNCCGGGGAINSFAPLHVTNSTLNSDSANVTDTSCCDGGGAVAETGTEMSVVGSELSHDTATVHTSASSSGLDSCCQGGGAVNIDDGSSKLSVDSSDFSDNRASTNSSVLSGGGGLYAYAPDGATFTDSTVSANAATATAGTVGGGGLMVDRSPAALTFMTIAGNHMSDGSGGGVFENQSTLDTKNSIVALNAATRGANCAGASTPTITSSGHNLENAPDTCDFTTAGDKVVPAASIKLGPLGNYGGATPTRELLPGSVAIDAVPLSFCTDQSTPTPLAVTADQRGVPRPEPTGGACDIGAYEFGQANVSLAASAASVKLGHRATLKFKVSDSGPVPATDTHLGVVLPAGARFVSGRGCAVSAGGASCALGTVSDGKPVTGSIVLATSKPGKLSVHALVSATEPDPSTANNSRIVTLTVKPPIPTLTHVSESHKRWREGTGSATFAKKRKKQPPLGTRFSFILNEKAKVILTFIEAGKGKRGHLSFSGSAGRDRVSFDGVTSGGDKLPPGSYRVLITAHAFGKTSKSAKLKFAIVG